MFQIGDKVSHPRIGACIVTSITEQNFLNEIKQYYILSSIVEPDSEIYIPVENAENIGVRSLISEEEANALLSSLPRKQEPWISDSNARKKKLIEINSDNSVDTLPSLLAAIQSILLRETEKPLGSSDKEMLNMMRNKAFSEIALAKDLELDDVIVQAEQVMLTLAS
ncbi:MAG: CarD family transcriptional regulator [Christensenellaceae bacterium]|jgi:CarD family transcriptional regulator